MGLTWFLMAGSRMKDLFPKIDAFGRKQRPIGCEL